MTAADSGAMVGAVHTPLRAVRFAKTKGTTNVFGAGLDGRQILDE